MNGKEKPKWIHRLTASNTSLTTGNFRGTMGEPPLQGPKREDREITLSTKKKLCLRPEPALKPTVGTGTLDNHCLQRSHFPGDCKYIMQIWILHFLLRYFVISFINVIKECNPYTAITQRNKHMRAWDSKTRSLGESLSPTPSQPRTQEPVARSGNPLSSSLIVTVRSTSQCYSGDYIAGHNRKHLAQCLANSTSSENVM